MSLAREHAPQGGAALRQNVIKEIPAMLLGKINVAGLGPPAELDDKRCGNWSTGSFSLGLLLWGEPGLLLPEVPEGTSDCASKSMT